MDTYEAMAIQIRQRGEPLRVLAAKVEDEESRETIIQWATDYERLGSALLKWGRSLADTRENHRLHEREVEINLSDTDQYHALITECQRLIRETKAWGGVFEEESEFIKELERVTRWRFAQSRTYLTVL